MKKFRVGIIGDFQTGKSTLINCLLGRFIATIGDGTSTTHTVVNYKYGVKEYIDIKFNNKDECETLPLISNVKFDVDDSIQSMDVFLNNPFLRFFELSDVPGWGYNTHDNKCATESLRRIDFAIVIMSNYKSIGGEENRSYYNIQLLKRYSIPYYAIINCIDESQGKWIPNCNTNKAISEDNFNALASYLPMKFPFEGNALPIINLMWYWFLIAPKNDVIIDKYSGLLSGYGLLNAGVKSEDILKASNFELINKIFSMENLGFLELMLEIKKLKNEICPIGTIQAFAFNRIPEGWMVCDGRSLNHEDYPQLFDAIGFTFGKINSNDFLIPDLRGCFIRGWDNEGIIDENRKFGSLQEDSLQKHRHSLYMESTKTKKDGSHDHYIGYETLYFGTNTWTSDDPCKSLKGCSEPHVLSYGDSTRAIHEHELPKIEVRDVLCNSKKDKVNVSKETRPKNIALLFCIKYC